jgi:multicopper oxidase
MTNRTRRLGLVLSLAAGVALLLSIGAPAQSPGMPKTGMVCTNGPSFALTTTTGNIQTPDGNDVFMWGYSANSDFQAPGPVLCVDQGDTVTVTLNNTLPEPVSIVFPGQEGVSASGGAAGLLTNEAPTGGSVTYTFTASRPGTYLYESGSDPSKQVEMGLYGALVVRPTMGSNFAYNNASTQFDTNREYLLLLSELDPDLHHAVETNGTYDFTKLHNRYFSINGREFPDTIQDNGSALLPNQPYGALVRLQPSDAGNASQNALVRMINAGTLNHPFHPHGNHTKEIAQDGRLVASSEHFGETIGSGQTKDYTLRWDNQSTDTAGHSFNDNWNPVTNPLPVSGPNYRNVAFGNPTFYSGDPYLGYKGTLPTGTASLNLCGEWFFPLHSHALDEFTNFDAPFGGMGTLLRVDPRGGCFAFPTSTKIQSGTLNSGSVTNLGADDTSYYKVNSTTSGTRTTDWYGQLSSIPAGAGSLKVTYKGNDTLPPPATYTQDFNSLASSGTSSSLPSGWALSESGTGANTTYTANNGSLSTANTYSYGSTGNGDRAFGGLRGTGGSALVPTIGSAFTNTTGGTITSLAVSYTGEQWRLGASGQGPDRLDFQYSTNATSLTTGTWTDVNSLDFNSPVTSGTVGALNGNSAANRTAVSGTITGLSIAPGVTYRIRWTDFDRGGSAIADDGLAVDGLSITPAIASPTFATTVSVWNWLTSSWVQIAGPTPVGATDVTVANNTVVPAAPAPGSWASYIGTGTNKGLVRVRVVSTGASTNFVTGGNLMKLVYDAP